MTLRRSLALPLALGVAAMASVVGVPAAASAMDSRDHDRPGCARDFQHAIEDYRQTTFDKDADGFNELLGKEVTLIFANGGTLQGKAESAAWIEGFFADPDWTQTLDVVRTTRMGCSAGFVLFDSVYTPSPESDPKDLAIGVTFVNEDGTWLVLQNQDSTGPVTH
jgi:uncharacterized protein (TIGR02246 family)